MLRKAKRVGLYMAVLWVSLVIPFLSVQATQLNPSVSLTSTNGVSELASVVNSYAQDIQSNFMYITVSVQYNGGAIVSIDTYSYKQLSNSDKRDLMSFTLSSISDSSLVAIDKTRLYNFVAETDTSVSAVVRQLSSDSKSDFYTAYSYIKPFSSPLGTVLALFSIGLFLSLIVSLLIDLGYIAIPLINMALSSGSTDKPKVVTAEAYKAFLEGSDKDSKKDILFLYLGKKWKQLVTMFVCILYLASGQIWSFVADIIDLFSGFIG